MPPLLKKEKKPVLRSFPNFLDHLKRRKEQHGDAKRQNIMTEDSGVGLFLWQNPFISLENVHCVQSLYLMETPPKTFHIKSVVCSHGNWCS